jgi:hypothetical protein
VRLARPDAVESACHEPTIRSSAGGVVELVRAGRPVREVAAELGLAEGTFSKQMNWVALGEFVLAVSITQMDSFRRLLGQS